MLQHVILFMDLPASSILTPLPFTLHTTARVMFCRLRRGRKNLDKGSNGSVNSTKEVKPKIGDGAGASDIRLRREVCMRVRVCACLHVCVCWVGGLHSAELVTQV